VSALRAIMSIPSVSELNILKVKGAFDCYTQTSYNKVRAAVTCIDTFNDTELWLLSFSNYLLSDNRNFKEVDFSPYYAIPTSKVQASSFEDFLNLLDTFITKRITPKLEKPLIEFLQGCTTEIRDYYELLMTKAKEAKNMFINKDIRSLITKLKPEDIYGNREEEWGNLSLPLMVTTAPPDLPLCMVYRSLKVTRAALFRPSKRDKGQYVREPLKGWMNQDSKTISTKDFVLLGVADIAGKKFYPLDYFTSVKAYGLFTKNSRKCPPYPERLAGLEHFLSNNYLRQIQRLPKRCCTEQSQIANAVAIVMQDSPLSTVLVCDGKSRLIQTETTELHGVIGSYWTSDSGTALGFQVWHMGRLLNCSYRFAGEDHALLFNPQLVLGKCVSFYLFDYNETHSGTVKEILVDQRPFKPTPYTFSDGSSCYIECCAFSTSTTSPYSHSGVSDSSLKNFFYMFRTYGTDVWLKPSLYMQRRREKHRWTPELFNKLEIVFRGYYVVANEEGEVMFRTDEKAMQIYQERMNNPEYNRVHLRGKKVE